MSPVSCFCLGKHTKWILKSFWTFLWSRNYRWFACNEISAINYWRKDLWLWEFVWFKIHHIWKRCYSRKIEDETQFLFSSLEAEGILQVPLILLPSLGLTMNGLMCLKGSLFLSNRLENDQEEEEDRHNMISGMKMITDRPEETTTSQKPRQSIHAFAKLLLTFPWMVHFSLFFLLNQLHENNRRRVFEKKGSALTVGFFHFFVRVFGCAHHHHLFVIIVVGLLPLSLFLQRLLSFMYWMLCQRHLQMMTDASKGEKGTRKWERSLSIAWKALTSLTLSSKMFYSKTGDNKA